MTGEAPWATWRTHPVWRWLPWSAAAHAALPVFLAAVWWAAGPTWVGHLLVGLHVVTAALALLALPWWWRHLGDVVLLVLVDHIVTFCVIAVLGMLVA